MNDDEVKSYETVDAPETVEVLEYDRMFGIVVDGVIGAIGGLVGTSALTVGLIVASAFGAFEMSSFTLLADLTGMSLLFPNNAIAAGFIVFLLLGMVPWPLFFASIGWYLPGDRFALKGIPFGAILWTGFVVGFYEGFTGIALVIYIVCTFVGHLAYGFSLGAVFDYLSDRPETLV
ncbi:MAG: DUF6789 family protein [Halobacteriota archaeon]